MDEVLLIVSDAAADAGISGFRTNSLQLLLYIFLFIAFFYVLYIVYKYFLPGGKHGVVLGRSKNIKVMEITSVGPGSTIQLVKVSEEYFLIGVTRTHINFMTKLDSSSIETAYGEVNENGDAKPKFLEVFANVVKKPKI